MPPLLYHIIELIYPVDLLFILIGMYHPYCEYSAINSPISLRYISISV